MVAPKALLLQTSWQDVRDLHIILLQVTKEDSDSHVIMATSDYGFINWIRKGVCFGARSLFSGLA
jgi:hypothetical protein